MTAGASVEDATRSPSFRAGAATWPDITIGTPASMAARKGSRSTASSRSRDAADDREPVVGVDGRVAKAREVLDRGGHAGALQAADERRAERATRGRVVAERADPEGRVGRVASPRRMTGA